MPFYGRDAELDELVSAEDRLVLLVGDQGVGKSAILIAAQEQTRTAPGVAAIAPPPELLRHAPASLQRGLLNSLSAATAQLSADATAVRKVGQHLVNAARRLGESKLSELPSAVGKAVLGVVRQKVGDEFADLLTEYVRELTTSVDERLEKRIDAANDPEVIDLLVSFIGELAALSDGRKVILALDGGDRLREDDLARLADLTDLMPEGAQLRVAFAVPDPEREERVSELEATGARVVRVSGLGTSAVLSWLSDEQLSSAHLNEVMRVTAGYAAHVQAAIALLRDGETLSGLHKSSVIAAQTKRAFTNLDLPSRRAVLYLVAFTDPLPPEFFANYLGIDVMGWHALGNHLRDRGIFSTLSNDRRWFHELRRRYLWEEILTEGERRESAEKAVRALTVAVNTNAIPSGAVVEVARLMPAAQGILDSEQHTRAVLEATADEVAVLAAVMELVEPQAGWGTIDATVAMLHARETFHTDGDLITALLALHDRELISVLSDQDRAVVGPIWRGQHAGTLIAARAAQEFERLPIFRAASTSFELIFRSLLEPFELIQYGIGRPDLADLASFAAQLQQVDKDGNAVIGRTRPGLLLRADVGSVPFYASVTYETEEKRDDAFEGITGLNVEAFSQEVATRFVLKYPGSRMPWRRVLNAAEVLAGTSLNGSMRNSLDREISLEEEVGLRVATLSFVRQLSSPLERAVMRLNEPVQLIFEGRETVSMIAEVYGREGLQSLSTPIEGNVNRPFFRFELSRSEGLSGKERLGVITFRGGPRSEDPVVDVLNQLSMRVRAFNGHQSRIRIHLDESDLSARLTAANRMLRSDVTAMEAAVRVSGHRDSEPVGRLAMVVVVDVGPERIIGLDTTVIYGHIPDGDPDDEVLVKVVRHTSRQDIGATFNSAFGLSASRRSEWSLGVGDATYVIAEMLGYGAQDIHLITE